MTVTTSEANLYSFFPYHVVGSESSKTDVVSCSSNNMVTVQVTSKGWFVTHKRTTLRGDILGTLRIDEDE